MEQETLDIVLKIITAVATISGGGAGVWALLLKKGVKELSQVINEHSSHNDTFKEKAKEFGLKSAEKLLQKLIS